MKEFFRNTNTRVAGKSSIPLNINWIIVLPFMIFSSATAQRFQAEFVGGINGSQVSGDQLAGFHKAGIFAGAGVRTRLNDKFELGFRLAYSQKGSRKPVRSDSISNTFYLLRLQYIECPLTLRYRLRDKFYLEAGPSLAYLLNASEEDENGVMNFRNPFLRIDISACGIFGYKISETIDFQFGYWQSLFPIREHGSQQVYRLNRGQYSSVVFVGFLYTLQSKKENQDSNQP
jgi:hypothetical protein